MCACSVPFMARLARKIRTKWPIRAIYGKLVVARGRGGLSVESVIGLKLLTGRRWMRIR